MYEFFASGTVPDDEIYHNADQDVFPSGSGAGIVAAAAFNGTYTEEELTLLSATYAVLLSFLAIA